MGLLKSFKTDIEETKPNNRPFTADEFKIGKKREDEKIVWRDYTHSSVTYASTLWNRIYQLKSLPWTEDNAPVLLNRFINEFLKIMLILLNGFFIGVILALIVLR